MTTQTEALELALEALETYKGFIDDAHIIEGQWHWIDGLDNVQTTIKEALAQQSNEQVEPFGIWHQGATEDESDFYLYKDSGDVSCPDCIKLYTHPPVPKDEQVKPVALNQVYRCKIKSRSQINREIPREKQGWWADVSAGQKLLLRQAVQADIDRCSLNAAHSKNPADYMCETHTNGSLVSKIALEYMNPEQNVFAHPPVPIATLTQQELLTAQHQWIGLTLADKEEYVKLDLGGNRLDAMDWAEKRLKAKNERLEKNT